MAWIKRNLFFVVAMIVGLALVGVAGFFAYTTIGANNDVRDQYNTAVSDLTTLQQKKPYPSDDNIRIAKEDSAHVADVVKEMDGAFVNFPEAPNVTPEEFIGILHSNLNFFRTETTNANVQLVSPDFSFSAEANSLSFQGNSFSAWIEQLEQIGSIVKILCDAKINSLDSLQRVPVGSELEAPNGVDYLQNTITSNQVSIISPYKIVFRGFSEEIAKVLEGFAKSPHCFLIMDIQVAPTKGAPLGSSAPGVSVPQYITVPRYVPGGGGFGQGGGGRRRRPMGMESQPQMEMEQILVNPAATPTGPLTILKPMPLFVTIVVDAVQLKKAQR